MEKLAEVLHELINAAERMLGANRTGELHALADDVAAALPEPEKAAVEVAADAPNAVETAVKTAETVYTMVQDAKEQVQAAKLALAPNGTLNANLPPAAPSGTPGA